jgi:LDH2 family malate/lactate/ureidoglycolate dehydrogenase
MNLPPVDFIRVREDRLLEFVTECFRRSGLDTDHAALIARLLVNNDLRGVRSHGSLSANGYCNGFATGGFNPAPEITVLNETQALVVLDGDGTLGYLPMAQAAQLAVDKARQHGVGVALVRHIGHYGSAGHYTRICSDAGCVGYSVQGYRGEAVPTSTPVLAVSSGNPPFSFALPGENEPAIVVDAGAAFDSSQFTEDGFEELARRFPSPFFKSMGMIATSTLIGGALTGYTGAASDAVQKRWTGAGMGGTVIVLDPDVIGDGRAFRAEVDRYVRDIRDGHLPLPGTDRVYLPGHVEEERMVEYRRDGIPFGEGEQSAMRELSERLDVAVPWDTMGSS